MINDEAVTLSRRVLEKLGLDSQPFIDDPSEEFEFEDSAHATQLNVVLHMLQTSDRLLIIRGDDGVGKSTLLKRLVSRDTGSLLFCRVNATADLDFSGLCQDCLSQIEASPPEPDQTMGDHLLAELRAALRGANRPVIVIDDADQLVGEALDELLRLRDRAQQFGEPFGLVLAGGSGLDERIESMRGASGITPDFQVVQLYPFTERQTGNYVEQRLAKAGSITDVLTETQVKQIFDRSKGIPAAINAEAALLLEQAHGTAPKRQESATSVKRPGVMIFVAALVVIVGGTVWVFARIAGQRTQPTQTTAIVIPKAQPSQTKEFGGRVEKSHSPSAAGSEAAAQSAAAPAPQPPKEAQSPPANSTGQPSTMAAEQAAKVPIIQKSAATPSAGPQNIPPSAPKTAQAGTASGTGANSGSTPPQAKAETPGAGSASTEAANQKSQSPRDETPNSTRSKATRATKSASDHAAKTAPPSPSPQTATKHAASKAVGGLNAEWVKTRPSTHLTIQLLGAYEPATVNRFVSRHKLEGKVAIVKTKRHGRDWYLVLMGDYASRNQAHKALAGLPKSLRGAGPWPRSFGSVRRTLVH